MRHHHSFSAGWLAVAALDAFVIIVAPVAGLAALGLLLILAGVTR